MKPETLRATESQTFYHRLLALLAISAAGYFQAFDRHISHLLLAATIAAYLGYILLLHYIILPRFHHRFAVFGMMAVDFSFAAAIIAFFGPASPVFLLFPLLVINHAFYLGYTGALVSATALSGIAAAVALSSPSLDVLALVAFRIPLLFLVALFVGYVARERFRERDARLSLQEVVRAEQKGRDLLELADSLAQAVDMGRLMDNIAASTLAGSGALHSSIYLREANGRLKLMASSSGYAIPAERPPAPPPDLLDRLEKDPLAAVALPCTIEPGASAVAVPLTAGGQVRGALRLCFPAGRTIKEREDIARAMALLASSAVEQADLILGARERSLALLNDLKTTVGRMGRFRAAQGRHPLAVGNLRLDPVVGEASLAGDMVALTGIEFEVLYLLADKAGLPVSKEMLFREVWGEKAGASNVVDVTVFRLRRKLEACPGGKDLVETVRGQGYRLRSTKS